jgi:hypothetical protein
VHRARFHCLLGPRLSAAVQVLGSLGPEEVAARATGLQAEYRALLEDGGEPQVALDSFLALQTAAVREQLVDLGSSAAELAMLGLRHRLALQPDQQVGQALLEKID